MKLTLTFVHVTATVSPTPSVISPTTMVDSTPFSVVAVVVPVLAVLVAGIAAVVMYIYVVAPFTCCSRICLSIYYCTVHAYIFLSTTVIALFAVIVMLMKTKGKKSMTRASVAMCRNILHLQM